MPEQMWSWVLSAVGLAGFFLAGRKVWWCWYVNIANQIIWLAYSLITHQYGFLVATAAYTVIFIQNAVKWTREHLEHKREVHQALLDYVNADVKLTKHLFQGDWRKPIGRVENTYEDDEGLHVEMNWDTPKE